MIRFSFKSDTTELKEFILKNSNSKTAKLDDIARLNILLGELFADSALRSIRKAGLKPEDIDLIGSHGQTIRHLPEGKKMFGKNISATFQISDPTIIAKRTGIIFRSEKINRGLLNIGGIANITVIPKSAKQNDVFAFDTGPGNMIIDNFTTGLFGKLFDINGVIAHQGRIDLELLTQMLKHPYLKMKPPKSTGRESFLSKRRFNSMKFW